MKLGFTGTRRGMTLEQKRVITLHLQSQTITEHYNGACVGADRDMYRLVIEHSNFTPTVFLPGNKEQYDWATKQLEQSLSSVRPISSYHKRNQEIVEETDILWAAPHNYHAIIRSGTWSTVRIARRVGKPVVIFWPDRTTTPRGA